ncbi:MAG: hypothetical protein WCI55_07555 [Armatimonadota bacterium]
MFDIEKIHCVIDSFSKFLIAAMAYSFIFYFDANRNSFGWIAGMLTTHIFGGLLVIAIRKRSLGFGLLNLGCEVFRLIIVAVLAIIPISVGVIFGLIPRQFVGITASQMEGIGFTFVGAGLAFVFIGLPALLLFWTCQSGIQSFYAQEPAI